jgi:hypothetical protein
MNTKLWGDLVLKSDRVGLHMGLHINIIAYVAIFWFKLVRACSPEWLGMIRKDHNISGGVWGCNVIDLIFYCTMHDLPHIRNTYVLYVYVVHTVSISRWYSRFTDSVHGRSLHGYTRAVDSPGKGPLGYPRTVNTTYSQEYSIFGRGYNIYSGFSTSLGRDNPVSRTYWYSLYACEHYFKIRDNPVLVQPLYNRTRFSTGDKPGDSRSRRRFYERRNKMCRAIFFQKREKRATKKACELQRTHQIVATHQMWVTLLELTAVEMPRSEYGASKIISTNHFISQVMRVMVPARFKPRKRAGVYFKREVRCRHPVAQ